MKNRIVILFILFTTVWSVIVMRALNLQLMPQSKLEQLQKRQFKTKVTLRSRRGTLFDRNQRELAVSVSSYSLYADPKIIKDPYGVSRKLSKYLRASRNKIYKKIKNKKKRFVWIERQLDKSAKEKVAALGIYGLGFIEEPKRIYPNNHLLSQVLGIVGREGLGLEGLELSLDKFLRGQNKKIELQRDARGRPLIMDFDMFEPPNDGADVTLTVDSELQFMLEKELSNSIHKYRANSAVGVILDAQTSEVLALANVPTFNTNQPFRYSPSYRKNRAVTDFFEPGSTIKTFVLAAALQEKLVKPNTNINTEGGRFKIGRRVITEADANHSFDKLTVSEVLAHSSNIGAAKIAFKVGDKKLRDYYSLFGFGEPAHIDFPGATKGLINKLPWRKHLLANISFGHGMAASPLQIASAYASLANGGMLRSPKLIKSIEGVDLKDEFKTYEHRVVSRKVAKTMRYLLTTSTAKGSGGYTARVPGFQVAGKTGTAQKVDFKKGGYLKGSYISSFAGFVPAHSPKFVIYIAVDDPQGKYYGATVAAPIFSRVAGYALRKAGIEPSLLTKKNLIGSFSPFKIKSKTSKKRKIAKLPKDFKVMPNLQGLSLREVLKVFNQQDVKVNIKGVGLVVDTTPKPGDPVGDGDKIRIILEPYY